MALLNWKPDYLLGNAPIDSDHRHLESIFVLQARLEEASIKFEKETIAFLGTWLTDHIAEEDRAFGRFLTGAS